MRGISANVMTGQKWLLWNKCGFQLVLDIKYKQNTKPYCFRYEKNKSWHIIRWIITIFNKLEIDNCSKRKSWYFK
jgi:hypothetical protein